MFQHLQVVRFAGKYFFTILNQPAIVVQVHGLFHQRMFQVRSSWRTGILTQVIFDRERYLAGAVARFRERSLKAYLFVLR